MSNVKYFNSQCLYLNRWDECPIVISNGDCSSCGILTHSLCSKFWKEISSIPKVDFGTILSCMLSENISSNYENISYDFQNGTIDIYICGVKDGVKGTYKIFTHVGDIILHGELLVVKNYVNSHVFDDASENNTRYINSENIKNEEELSMVEEIKSHKHRSLGYDDEWILNNISLGLRDTEYLNLGHTQITSTPNGAFSRYVSEHKDFFSATSDVTYSESVNITNLDISKAEYNLRELGSYYLNTKIIGGGMLGNQYVFNNSILRTNKGFVVYKSSVTEKEYNVRLEIINERFSLTLVFLGLNGTILERKIYDSLLNISLMGRSINMEGIKDYRTNIEVISESTIIILENNLEKIRRINDLKQHLNEPTNVYKEDGFTNDDDNLIFEMTGVVKIKKIVSDYLERNNIISMVKMFEFISFDGGRLIDAYIFITSNGKYIRYDEVIDTIGINNYELLLIEVSYTPTYLAGISK